jgi:hypothetical protein
MPAGNSEAVSRLLHRLCLTNCFISYSVNRLSAAHMGQAQGYAHEAVWKDVLCVSRGGKC